MPTLKDLDWKPMRSAAVTVLAALAFTASAQASPPGFYEAKVLEPAASFVAHKPAQVFCSRTTADYTRWTERMGFGDFNDGLSWTETTGVGYFNGGLTLVGSNQTALPTEICATLKQKLHGRTVDMYALAAAVTTLVHEAVHMRGDANEGDTECHAMHESPHVAVKFFQVKPGKQLRTLKTQAWYFYRMLPPQYQTC